MDGLLLAKKINEDLEKIRISDDLLSKCKRSDALGKDFRDTISLEQKKFVLVLINNVIIKWKINTLQTISGKKLKIPWQLPLNFYR